MTKVCITCGEEKDESEFFGTLWCNECRKKFYKPKHVLLDELKTDCAKCGESRRYLIDFHHVIPSRKSFEVSQTTGRDFSEIEEEAKKCVCLCANCHREFHYIYGRKPWNPKQQLEEYLGRKL